MDFATSAADAAVAAEIDRAGFTTVVTIVFDKATGFITATEHLDNFCYFYRPEIEVVLYPEPVPVVVVKKDTLD